MPLPAWLLTAGKTLFAGATAGAASGIGRRIDTALAGNKANQYGVPGTGAAVQAQAMEGFKTSQAASQGQNTAATGAAMDFQSGESEKQRDHEKDMLAMSMSMNGQYQGQVPWWAAPPAAADAARNQSSNPTPPAGSNIPQSAYDFYRDPLRQ